MGTNKSTIFSDDGTKKSPVEQVAIPELPKMLTKISMDQFVDENTITEMSGIHTNENLDNLFVNINTNNTNNTMMHQDKINNTSPPGDKEYDHDGHTHQSNKIVAKYSSLSNRKREKKNGSSHQRRYRLLLISLNISGYPKQFNHQLDLMSNDVEMQK